MIRQTMMAAFALLATASGTAHADPLCPSGREVQDVLGIGSSTMGSILGPMLKHTLRDQGIAMHYWGQASTGLARPDYHDWIGRAPALTAEFHPEVVVVALGVNDSQNLWDRGQWIQREAPEWEEVYAGRVDAMLDRAAGDDRQRLVVWVGPYAYVDWRAEEQLPIVVRILKERIAAFVAGGGRAALIDVYAPTMGEDGRPRRVAVVGEDGLEVAIRGDDGIHLTVAGVRSFMLEPVLQVLSECRRGADDVANDGAHDRANDGDRLVGDAAPAPEAAPVTRLEEAPAPSSADPSAPPRSPAAEDVAPPEEPAAVPDP